MGSSGGEKEELAQEEVAQEEGYGDGNHADSCQLYKQSLLVRCRGSIIYKK